MAPPLASLEDGTLRFAGGVKPFSSGAADIEIPHSAMLACFVGFITYNIAVFFDINLPTIINFGIAICQTLIDWVALIHQHIPNFQLPAGLQRTLLPTINFGARIYNWDTATYRSSMNAHAFRAGLKRMTSNPREHLGRTILVDTITVPGAGSLALIHGIPSDISAPEIRRYLETALFLQYSPLLNASLDRVVNRNATHHNANRTGNGTTNRPDADNTEDAQVDTSRPGLWNGTCFQPTTSNVSTSTPGNNTPTSGNSASGAPVVSDPTSHVSTSAFASDSPVLNDLTLPSSNQRRSHSRRT